ncbi:MAG: DUF2207 domain-containing protein [Lewinellaceae bacterium]|nr:DUF2207 domain-containing protein [Lewinellaceae bacterium]
MNPLNFFDQNIEFYWDLLGTQWEVPIRAFTFDIEVPARIALQNNDIRVFTGVKGSTSADARFGLPDEHTVEGQTTRAFEPHEGLTLAIRLPQDSFQPMSATESPFADMVYCWRPSHSAGRIQRPSVLQPKPKGGHHDRIFPT